MNKKGFKKEGVIKLKKCPYLGMCRFEISELYFIKICMENFEVCPFVKDKHKESYDTDKRPISWVLKILSETKKGEKLHSNRLPRNG